jgi:hypothetical protein
MRCASLLFCDRGARVGIPAGVGAGQFPAQEDGHRLILQKTAQSHPMDADEDADRQSLPRAGRPARLLERGRRPLDVQQRKQELPDNDDDGDDDQDESRA